MTTFEPMRRSFLRSVIIGALALALTACSALRLGYDNGPGLALWWLDNQLDFSDGQEGQAREALERAFAWHRASELPDYADALAAMRARAGGAVDGAQVCTWTDQWRARIERVLDRVVPTAADMLPGISAAQWQRLERKQAGRLQDLREEFLQADPAERAKATWQRALDRAEMLYGPLGDAQRKVLAAGIEGSPFDPQRWVAERQRRQRDAVQLLKSVQGDGVEARRRALRTLAQRLFASPDPGHRDYQRRLTDYNCRLAAELHNATDATQREHLRQRLAGWEEDLRALAARAQGS